MSVEDVLGTHPHLAGDALVEQHKREQQERLAQAEAEKEAENSANDLPDWGLGEAAPGTGVEAGDPNNEDVAPQPAAETPAQSTSTQPSPGGKRAKGEKSKPKKGLLEQSLLDNYERESADQEMADETALADFHNPFTFKRDPKTKSGFPGEVDRFLEGAPRGVKSLFNLTDSATGGQGADAFGKLGDKYFDIAGRRGGMTGKLKQAIEAGKNSPDPQIKWAAHYYDLPKPDSGGKKGRTTENVDLQKQPTGTKATVKGAPVEIVKDDDGQRVLRDGDELPDLPVDAAQGPIPFDKGSLKPGRPESLMATPEAAETPPAPKPKSATARETPETTSEPAEPASAAQEPVPEAAPTPAPAPASSPEEIEADIRGGLASMGMNLREAEAAARAAMESGQATTAQDGLKWALMNPGARPAPAPAPSAPVAPKPSRGAATPPTQTELRQRAGVKPPPTKLPPTVHQDPPAKIKKSAQSSSALAASKTIKPAVGSVRAPSMPRLPSPRLSAGRSPSLASHIGKNQPHLHAPHTALRNSIGQQAGQSRHVKAVPPRRLSQAEIERAKGQKIEELQRFSAESTESIAQTLALLELVSD